MKIIMLGAPGAGKGTQAAMIAEEFNVPHISTGDILRRNMKEGTPLGLKAKAFVESGGLVPDEVVIGLVKDRLEQDDCKNGYILDGFPRTIAQAEELDKVAKIDMAINIDVPFEVIVERLGGRRVCVCGAGCGRILWKEEKRAADRVYCSCAGEGIFPYVRRVSVLDGLYAGEFPAVFKGAVSDYLQLQLSAG